MYAYHHNFAANALTYAAIESDYEPEIWDALVAPTFLWPNLDTLKLQEWFGFSLNETLDTWSKFCRFYKATLRGSATSSLRSLAAPVSIADLNVIADSFGDTIECLWVKFPSVYSPEETAGRDFLKAISRFPNLRRLTNASKMEYNEVDMLQYLSPMRHLDVSAIDFVGGTP